MSESDAAPISMTSHTNAGNGSSTERIESLYALLKARADTNPAGTAIAAPGRTNLTYARLLQQAEVPVKTLRGLGIGRQDRVAAVLPNGPELAAAFASIACGAAFAPLNPAYKAGEFDFYLSDLKARALVIAPGMDSPAREIARKRNIPIIELSPAIKSEAGLFSLAGAPADECDFAQPDDTALLLHTSGTTSRPKLVPLSHTNICSSALNIASTLGLRQTDRCLNVMPLFHIHGLMAAVAASLMAGATVICATSFDPGEFFNWMDGTQPTWYTAVPTIHQSVLSQASANREVIARRPLRFIRSSSAALPKPVWEALESVFQTQVIEAYGMTEACHQIASNPLSPRFRKPASVGIAAGPEIAIMDGAGCLLAAGETGEIAIRGPNVTSGYEDNPTANQSAFAAGGWFRTGDQGRLDAAGYLFLTGRLKELINRGGEKISPQEVDEILLQHPAIAQAAAFAVPHATLGEEVAAAVVLKQGQRTGAGGIREFVAARLSGHKVPKQVLIVGELPKGPAGKLQRIGLADKLAERLAGDAANDSAAPSSEIEKEVAAIWGGLLQAGSIGVRENFHSLGGDSLSLAQMLARVRSRWGVQLPVSAFLAHPTIEGIVHCVLQGNRAKAGVDSAAPARRNSRGLRIKASILGDLKNRLFQYLALYIPGYKTSRVWLHRKRGVSIGKNASIGLSVLIETAYPQLVSLGDNVSIGIRSVIIGHLRDSTTQALLADRPAVTIEDDVYIGPGVIILPNVTIGKGAVIGAGSVVSRSIPAHTLARGNPAVPVARCGVSLGGGVSYEQFLNHLTPFAASHSEKLSVEAGLEGPGEKFHDPHEQPGVSRS